jgi:hypothetical protein
MRGRRLYVLVATFALLLFVGCAPPPSDDATSATDEPTSNQAADECIEGDGSNPQIEWQNTTVDIEPTSRFGEESDTAVITTTLAAAEDNADEVARELGNLEGADVEVSEDGRLFTVVQRTEVPEVDEDEFHFQMRAPLDGTELAKNGNVSVVVQLPRVSEGHEDVPAYKVELVEASSDDKDVPGPTIHDGEENDLIGERITVTWFWCVDPPLDVVYKMVLP